jgi:DNA replication and repair protein RecF
LKLAELDFITHVTNEIPILLLDDVMAELDKHRQNYILKSVDKAVQTIITAAEITSFETDFLKKTAVYTIDAGKIYT